MAAVAERYESPAKAEALQAPAANDANAGSKTGFTANTSPNTAAGLTPFVHAQANTRRVLRPPADVVEDAEGVTLTLDLPGVRREDLRVDVQADRLSIDAALTLPAPAGLEARHAEVRLARYQRAFTLAPELDAGSVDAKLEHGVLTLRIAKAANALPRRVDVRVG